MHTVELLKFQVAAMDLFAEQRLILNYGHFHSDEEMFTQLVRG
jgi:hypothetical protein